MSAEDGEEPSSAEVLGEEDSAEMQSPGPADKVMEDGAAAEAPAAIDEAATSTAAAQEPESPSAAPTPPPIEAPPPAPADSPAEAPSPKSPEIPAPAPAKVFTPPPRAAWAGEAVIDEVSLTDAALAAAYLRRLGIDYEEAVTMASSQPLRAGTTSSKGLISDLLQRHLLRIPFENLEQHRKSPTPLAARQARLREAKAAVERLVAGWTGGICFDLNPAFAWLLRQLGAKARLGMAWVAETGTGAFTAQATHCVILVDLPDGSILVDVGFGDPPRVALKTEGETPDDLALYEVVALEGEASRPGPGYTHALKRSSGGNLCRHIDNPDESGLDNSEASSALVYAFRPGDDLAPGSEDLQRGLEAVLTGPSLFTDRRIVCLCTPKGHIVLSEHRMRKVEGERVAEELEVDGEETWRKFASEIFGYPLLNRQLKMGRALPATRKTNSPLTPTAGSRFTAGGSEQMSKAETSKEAASAKTKGLGVISAGNIAVGGAGAGGGMGLNAPGFGRPVQHFSGGRAAPGGLKSVNIDEEIKKAWKQVMDDSDPLGWIFCEYSGDGKALELKGKGEGGLKAFKDELGAVIGWGGFRCCGVDRRGGVECKRPKFIFVQYKPEAVSAMKKAKQGSHKGDVKEVISGAHLDIMVENDKDLDEHVLIEKLQAATGAHKPNGYEFEEGVFLEADFYGLGIGKDCKGETSKN